jgi:hypothetical protein
MSRRSIRLAIAIAALCGAATQLYAQVPHSVVASPDIYKVIAEDARYRVIEVTWAAGQRDAQHSHPAAAVYYPMDCSLRQFGGDGAVLGQRDIPAGAANVQGPVPSHSVQNIGAKACKIIMFEPK